MYRMYTLCSLLLYQNLLIILDCISHFDIQGGHCTTKSTTDAPSLYSLWHPHLSNLRSAPVSSSELSKDITQDDDIASTAKVTALENLPLVNIGMDSDWNFFNIVTVIKSKV